MNARSAAIFDLDRTLIAGASGPAFARAFETAGLTHRRVPGVELVAATFRLIGETALTAPAAKAAARAAAGW